MNIVTLNDLRRAVFAVCTTLLVASMPSASAQVGPPVNPVILPETVVVDRDSVFGVATALAHRAGAAGHILWLDATANVEALSTPEGIERVVAQAKRAHINTLVMDVKPLSGHVVYKSAIAPPLTEWKGIPVDPTFDRLAAVIESARRHGLRVSVSVNVFSEGHKHFNAGPAYGRPEWQSISYHVERFVTAANGSVFPLHRTANARPPVGDLAVLTTTDAAQRLFRTEALSAVVSGEGIVLAVGDAPTIAATIRLPERARVLTGAGAAADWLVSNLQVGTAVAFSARPVLMRTEHAPWEEISVFVSPHVREVRDYQIAIMREIAANYDIDGIVYDRMRYSGLGTDFSDLARAQFEAYIGHTVTNWPFDIYYYPDNPAEPRRDGPLFKKWIEFRAATIRSFAEEAGQAIRAVRPQAELSAYVGSWYSEYYGVGVNWASDDYHAGFDWMTPEFHRTGYAGLLDWITTGCYFPTVSKHEARATGRNPRATVEHAAAASNRFVNDVTFVYGGLYLLNYSGKPEDFGRAVQVARAATHGVMIFDLFYLDAYGWWDVLAQALAADAPAPHAVPGLLPAVRSVAEHAKSLAGAREAIPAEEIPISDTP